MGPRWGALRVDPEDKVDQEEARVRSFLLEHYQLITPLRICRLVVAANRVSETKFNTKQHYLAHEAKRAGKRKLEASGDALQA